MDYKTYAKYDAMLAFAKNLSVKTKQIDDFKLQAQVISIEKGKLAGDIGHKEGVHLDDGYHICEATETADGEVKMVKKGFTRVWKTGKNQTDESATSLFDTYYGKGDIGMVLMEHPTLGIDVQVTVGMLTGMNISKVVDTGLLDTKIYFEEDVSDAVIIDFKLMNNVASVVNSRQLFVELGGYYGMPTVGLADQADLDLEAGESQIFEDVTPSLVGAYLGLNKKVWMGRLGFNFGAQCSYDMLSFDLGNDVALNFHTIGVKGFGGAEYMINQDILIDLQVGYKYAFDPRKAEYTYSGGSELEPI